MLFLLFSVTSLFSETVNVAAAASMERPLTEVNQLFTKETGIKVKTQYGASGKFYNNIREGKEYDAFLSANGDYPLKLYNQGLGVTEPRSIARGQLVLYTVKKDLDISRGLDVLNDPEVEKIAIANPDTAPYGNAAKEAKDHAFINNLFPKQSVTFSKGISSCNVVFAKIDQSIPFPSANSLIYIVQV